jgi:hypothetical protein
MEEELNVVTMTMMRIKGNQSGKGQAEARPGISAVNETI